MTFAIPYALRSWFADRSHMSDSDLAECLHYGIEIEFSRADGLVRQEPSPPELPDDDDVIKWKFETDPTGFTSSLFYLQEWYNSLINQGLTITQVKQAFRCMFDRLISSNEYVLKDWLSVYCDRINSVVDRWKNDWLEYHQAEVSSSEDYSDGWLNLSGWKHESDGTSGIKREYNSDDPCLLPELDRRIDRLLSVASDWTCPVNGSCHVHISVPGMRHKLSDDSKLGQLLYAELFSANSVAMFPDGLVERLKHGDTRSYFDPSNSHSQKYCAIHSHRYGTLEFRLFGHIGIAKDARTNARIAGLAFIRAYRRFLAGDFVAQSVDLTREQIRNCMCDGGSYHEPHPYDLLVTIGRAHGIVAERSMADNVSDGFREPVGLMIGDVCTLVDGTTVTIARFRNDNRPLWMMNNGWYIDERFMGAMYDPVHREPCENDVAYITRYGRLIRDWSHNYARNNLPIPTMTPANV